MNEVAINKILRYLDDLDDDFGDPCIRPELFEEQSFSRWAVYEILHMLMDRPFDPASVVIESFVYKMTPISYESVKLSKGRMFEAARNVADDILHLLSKGEHQ